MKESALGPLLAWALEVVPAGRHKDTPIFLFATAGLRNLPKEQQDNVLEAVKTTLHDTPFRSISFFLKATDRSSLSQLHLLFLPLGFTVSCPSGILIPLCVVFLPTFCRSSTMPIASAQLTCLASFQLWLPASWPSSNGDLHVVLVTHLSILSIVARVDGGSPNVCTDCSHSY